MKTMSGKKNNWELLKDYFRHGYWDTDTHLLEAYANHAKLTKYERIMLAFHYSTCYNVPTAVWLMSYVNIGTVDDIWEKYKAKLIFQTDRKWVRITDNYPQLYKDFCLRFNMNVFLDNPNFDTVYNEFTKLKGQGRVSAYIFIDGLIATGIMKPSMPSSFDWNNGQTCTEGMLHALDRPEEVAVFDKGKRKLSKDTLQELDEALVKLTDELTEEGMSYDNVCDYESNLCAFRKYFKDHMYIGYYVDRNLGELNKLQQSLPEFKNIWSTLFNLRAKVYPSEMLGEVNGWSGQRKELYDVYKRTGELKP